MWHITTDSTLLLALINFIGTEFLPSRVIFKLFIISEISIGVQWEKLTSVEAMLGLTKCRGSRLLDGIFSSS